MDGEFPTIVETSRQETAEELHGKNNELITKNNDLLYALHRSNIETSVYKTKLKEVEDENIQLRILASTLNIALQERQESA